MGSIQSKYQHDDGDGRNLSTPCSKPNSTIVLPDPRSPSVNIVRTPMQGGGQPDNLTPIIGYIDSKISSDNFINDQVNVDPRSPTVAFVRTPIQLGNKAKINVPSELVKKQMMDKVKKGLVGSKLLSDSGLDTEEEYTSDDDLPKTVSLDTSASSYLESKDQSEIECKNESKLTHRKPKLLEVNHIVKKSDVDVKRHSTIGLLETNMDDVCQDTHDEPQLLKIPEQNKPKEQKDNSTKEFDKKVSSLIYEDTNQGGHGKVFSKGNGRNVLGERNILENLPKSLNKLKVNDHPTLTSHEKISKIPVLKKKLKQCENTPPNNKMHIAKKSEWGSDNTLII